MPPPAAKGKGKHSKLPVDTDELLMYEGFEVEKSKVARVFDALDDHPFNSVYVDIQPKSICVDPLIKELESVCKQLQLMEGRMSRRQCTPADALSQVHEFRGVLRHAITMLADLKKQYNKVDSPKLAESLQVLEAAGYDMGPLVKSRMHMRQSTDLLDVGNITEAAKHASQTQVHGTRVPRASRSDVKLCLHLLISMGQSQSAVCCV